MTVEDKSFDERLRELLDDVCRSDLNCTINHLIDKCEGSEGCINLEEEVIEMMQDYLEARQVLRDDQEGKYLSFLVGCCALFIMFILAYRFPGGYAFFVSLPFAVAGLFLGAKAGKIKREIRKMDIHIKAISQLLVGLIGDKIRIRMEQKAKEKFVSGDH